MFVFLVSILSFESYDYLTNHFEIQNLSDHEQAVYPQSKVIVQIEMIGNPRILVYL